MNNDPLKISIVTINYNDAKGLEKTLFSVVNQSWKNFEHIVIDGDSTDNSIDVIKSFAYPQLNWISEPDTGIYNAMNKGIKRASGIYLLFLNSGDCLIDNNTLEKVFQKSHKEDILYGYIKMEVEEKLILKTVPENITFEFLLQKSLLHPATFYQRSLFNKIGLYNEKNKIISDWEFNLKAIVLHNCSTKCLGFAISVFDMAGISSQASLLSLKRDEGKRALESVFGTKIATYIIESEEIKKELKQLYRKRIFKWFNFLEKIKK